MNNKKLTLMIASLLLFGIMISGIVLSQDSDINYIGYTENPSGINISDFTAGTVTQAEFSFDYSTFNIDEEEQFPLIYKIDFNSSEEIPEVWKNDFNVLGGNVKRSLWTGGFNEISLECTNEFPITINHPIGSETIEGGENGTFYCYNTTQGTLDNLKRHNKVSLDITTHPALYPGDYGLSAKMFYLNDTYAPEVEILDKSYFDQYFTSTGKESVVKFYSSIDEINLKDYWGKIIDTSEGNRSFDKEWAEGDTYKFFDLPDSIEEGNYELKVIAKDFNGHVGMDNTTIKIDNTAPEIELIEPKDKTYSGILPIEFNVTDEKVGVKNVSYRLKEMDENNNVCYVGNSSWDCYDSGWEEMDVSEKGVYKDEINTTDPEVGLESGRYWIQAKACDELGNCKEFDPADKR